jgi:xanthine/uracil/vitamin C permease (AzgA family)
MSIWGVRELLMRAIPDSLKHAIAVGIGLLITLVGLEWGGWVQSNPGLTLRWAICVSRRYGCPEREFS